MKLIQLKQLKNVEHNQKLNKVYLYFLNLTTDLENRQLSLNVIDIINEEINNINKFSGTNKEVIKNIELSIKNVLITIEKELDIVLKQHYQRLWMIYGMIIGTLFSIIVTTIGYENTWYTFPTGTSIGLLLGLIAGKKKDSTVKKRNLQLN